MGDSYVFAQIPLLLSCLCQPLGFKCHIRELQSQLVLLCVAFSHLFFACSVKCPGIAVLMLYLVASILHVLCCAVLWISFLQLCYIEFGGIVLRRAILCVVLCFCIMLQCIVLCFMRTGIAHKLHILMLCSIWH